MPKMLIQHCPVCVHNHRIRKKLSWISVQIVQILEPYKQTSALTMALVDLRITRYCHITFLVHKYSVHLPFTSVEAQKQTNSCVLDSGGLAGRSDHPFSTLTKYMCSIGQKKWWWTVCGNGEVIILACFSPFSIHYHSISLCSHICCASLWLFLPVSISSSLSSSVRAERWENLACARTLQIETNTFFSGILHFLYYH